MKIKTNKKIKKPFLKAEKIVEKKQDAVLDFGAIGMLAEWGDFSELTLDEYAPLPSEVEERAEQILKNLGFKVIKYLAKQSEGARYPLILVQDSQGEPLVAKIGYARYPTISFLRHEARMNNTLFDIVRRLGVSVSIPAQKGYLRIGGVEILLRSFIKPSEKRPQFEFEKIYEDLRLIARVAFANGIGLPARSLRGHWGLVAQYLRNLPWDTQKEETVIRALFEEIAPHYELGNCTLVHGDLHQENVLPYGDGYALIDLEYCRIGHLMEDVAAAQNIAEITGKPFDVRP